MKKLLIVFGTRPEAIKMAPLVKELKKHTADFMVKVCVTAQHRQMLDQVLEFFAITPDYDLNIMKSNQNLYSLTGDILIGMKGVLDDYTPDYVFVHGDTTTSMATSLSCFYGGVKICHIEAGLRTHNKLAPFPEEMNRVITGRLADYHFSPTPQARQNLLQEGISSSHIIVTGNTVIDALFLGLKQISVNAYAGIDELKKRLRPDMPIVLVTGHRRENFGEGFINICKALKQIADSNLAQVVYPVHLNPNVQDPVSNLLTNVPNVILMEPLAYPQFIWLMNQSKIIITDSGGIQEEAPSLGKPVLVMREATERPEAVEAGTVILVGTNQDKIVTQALQLLTSEYEYERMSKLHNPYGDGNACPRIANFMRELN
ncbi:MAG: UDP-N-acetylglucosamine 2-epimerase (non-hydrolyzing) [Chryseolinea sp.]